MIVAVLKETVPGERRVALVPAVVKCLVDAGFQVVVESGAGVRAGFPDAAYLNHAARLAESREALFAEAEVLLQVRSDSLADVADLERLHSGQTLIALCNPLGNPTAIQSLASRGVTVFALELLPRIARAQSMDVLSSMATIAGYKAVLLAANTLPRMFPMMITAAGTVAPARVFVLGAGVAGSRRLRRLDGWVGSSTHTTFGPPFANKSKAWRQTLSSSLSKRAKPTGRADTPGTWEKTFTTNSKKPWRKLLHEATWAFVPPAFPAGAPRS